MKGDFSRETFDPARHFSSVRVQQGRVQLDADHNEQADIVNHRVETQAVDAIGGCGAPARAAAFGIVVELTAADRAAFGLPSSFTLAAGDFLLTPGRYYVDGILCENERAVPYLDQPDLTGLSAIDLAKKGSYVVYLDVWQRHITALDVPALREIALGGPDTTTRAHTVWQVRTVFAGTDPIDCRSRPQAYTDAIAPSTGRLRARGKPPPPGSGPCVVPPTADYRGLENQLYRVEIHDPGAALDLSGAGSDTPATRLGLTEISYGSGTFSPGDAVEVYLSKPGLDPMAGRLGYVVANDTAAKKLTLNVALPTLEATDLPRVRHVNATYVWSRDNGSVAALVEKIADRDVTLHNLGPDDVLGFEPGQWVELIDQARELRGEPGHLGQIESVTPATRTLHLYAAPKPFPGDVAVEVPERRLKARRWDGAGAVEVGAPAPSDGYAELEDGVQVRFEAGTFATGDYWLAPARTATADAQSGTVDWPNDGGQPVARAPIGIRHHYCRVGILDSDGTKLAARDCRPLFPPTTELLTMVYVGGDGQGAMPGDELPKLLEVGVFHDRWPVAGARVKYETKDGGFLAKEGTHTPTVGGSSTLDDRTEHDGILRCVWRPAAVGLSQRVTATLLDDAGNEQALHIDFNAQLSVADQVAYTAEDVCTYLAGAKTVKDALDALCRRPTGGCSVTVRPEDRLDEVLDRLVEQGERDLCVCLTGGDHELASTFTLDSPALKLKLTGCGPGTRLRANRFALNQLRGVLMRDFELVLLGDNSLSFSQCEEVAIEGLRISRELTGPVICRIGGAQRIRILDSVIDAHVGTGEGHPIGEVVDILHNLDRRNAIRIADKLARVLAQDPQLRGDLAQRIHDEAPAIGQLSAAEQAAYNQLVEVLELDPVQQSEITDALMGVYDASAAASARTTVIIDDGAARTHIAGSELVGELSLYGAPGGGTVTAAQLKQLRVRIGETLTLATSRGTLHLHDNRLTRMTLDGIVVRNLVTAAPGTPTRISGLYAECLIADNRFVLDDSLMLAGHFALTANEFAELDPAGAAIANSIVVTSNHAPAAVRLSCPSKTFAEVANLTINVVQ
jgi:Family of unknown function (DUF6519)